MPVVMPPAPVAPIPPLPESEDPPPLQAAANAKTEQKAIAKGGVLVWRMGALSTGWHARSGAPNRARYSSETDLAVQLNQGTWLIIARRSKRTFGRPE
jgi:hypothetical protein